MFQFLTKVIISWLFTEVDVASVAYIRFFADSAKKPSYEYNTSDIYFSKKPENNYFNYVHLFTASNTSQHESTRVMLAVHGK